MGTKKIQSHKDLTEGPWKLLLAHAFEILDDLKRHGGIEDPFWTLGGGTVLMLRHRHRKSKDIDIFVPDPQYLGFVTPRLSDVAASISQDYVEAAGFVKLIRPEGEIDFVAEVSIEEGLRRTVEWTKQNIDLISKTIAKHDANMAAVSNA